VTERRFTVKRWHQSLGPGWRFSGWVVFDRQRPITIAFDDFAEALRHRDNIAMLYYRFGW